MNKKFPIHPKRIYNKVIKSVRDFVVYYLVPDRLYLIVKFRKVHGYKLDLKHPVTIDEKLQWIKLYDRKPIYHKMIDKIASKSFVEEKLGTKEYTIPLLGKWKSFDDIDFSVLPNKFVLKCNHDSYSWVICKNKAAFNVEAAKKKLTEALKTNYYRTANKQWGYDMIEPMIFAEKYLDKEKLEYQVFCNNGIPVFFLVRSDLGENQGGFNVCYSMEWKKMEYRVNTFPDVNLNKPKNYDQMVEISKVLSEGTLHLRVDFYEMDGKLYIGELTFYSNGGDFHNFSDEGKKVLSDTLNLPV